MPAITDTWFKTEYMIQNCSVVSLIQRETLECCMHDMGYGSLLQFLGNVHT